MLSLIITFLLMRVHSWTLVVVDEPVSQLMIPEAKGEKEEGDMNERKNERTVSDHSASLLGLIWLLVSTFGFLIIIQ